MQEVRGGGAGEHGERAGTYSQLEAEGHPQHLEALHLKIHPNGCLVVLVEGVFAKAGGWKWVSAAPDPPTLHLWGLSAPHPEGYPAPGFNSHSCCCP